TCRFRCHFQCLVATVAPDFHLDVATDRRLSNEPRELLHTDNVFFVVLRDHVAFFETRLCRRAVRFYISNDRSRVLLILYRNSQPTGLLSICGNCRKHNCSSQDGGYAFKHAFCLLRRNRHVSSYLVGTPGGVKCGVPLTERDPHRGPAEVGVARERTGHPDGAEALRSLGEPFCKADGGPTADTRQHGNELFAIVHVSYRVADDP